MTVTLNSSITVPINSQLVKALFKRMMENPTLPQELLFPRMYWSLRSAMMPVMSVSRTGVESALFGRKAKGRDDLDDDDEEEDDDKVITVV